MSTDAKKENKVGRPPIIVIMGHIDHGKSKLLETIRKTRMLDKEAGGITQHIGAYEAVWRGKKITFIDTPGHEAFSALRSRGAQVADIAVLVIAADEGIKPQTIEALEIIQKAKLPFVIAINKIDKAEANPQKVKQELAEHNILVEEYGGKIPSVELSAQTGENIDELLELLLLMAEIEELKADPDIPAQGVVIEAHLDPRKGKTATLLIREGSLNRGDIMVIGKSIQPIKILNDFLGRAVDRLGPSSPAQSAGFSELPVVGDKFVCFKSRQEAQNYISSLPQQEQKQTYRPTAVGSKMQNEAENIFNLILKTDTAGSQEALESVLKKLGSDILNINLIQSGIGNITESDIKSAIASKVPLVAGFKVKIDPSARELAKSTKNITIITGEVIYELVDSIKKFIEEHIPAKIIRNELGSVKILKIFQKVDGKQIIGGVVQSGEIKADAVAQIIRGAKEIGTGKIVQLKKGKDDVAKVEQGSECGIMIDAGKEIKPGDILVVFEEIIEKIRL